MNYYLLAFKNYANFSGRSRRSEYWFFLLFHILFSIATIFLDYYLATRYDIEQTDGYTHVSIHFGYINLLYSIAVFIPGLSVLVRRLHDVGKSGWFFLIALIPLVGPIWLLVVLFTDSQNGENQYGPNPKGIGNYDEIDQIGSNIIR